MTTLPQFGARRGAPVHHLSIQSEVEAIGCADRAPDADRRSLSCRSRSATARSERNLVVHVVALGGPGHGRLALARRARSATGSAGAEVVAAVGARAAATAAGIEHGELRVEALQHHFGRVALVAVFVRPFARLQRAFQINLRALLEILLDDLAETLVEHDDAMPLGFFLALAGGLVAPAFRGRHPQIRDRPSVP